MSLRARLILSYFVVLAVTLMVIVLALLVFLLARPANPAPTYDRLATIARDFVAQNQAAFGNRLSLAALRDLPERLGAFAAENEVRAMVIDLRTETVVSDSMGVYQRGDALELLPEETYTLPLYLRRGLAVGSEPIIGSFQTPDNAVWLFTGLALTRGEQETIAAILSDLAPPRTPASVIAEFRESLLRPLCQAALVGLVMALLLAVVISRNVANSLAALSEAAGKVAEGNYQWRVSEAGPPEVRAVAGAFNAMSGQVHAAQQAQQDFVANVSHDLKTPLTSIQGYSQAIMDGAANDPADAARIIHEEAARLNRMVVELTDLARLEAGQLSMQMLPLDIAALVAAIGERMNIVAQRKNVTLHIEAAPVPAVMGDGDRLAQVLTNLAGNALNYTPAGGNIWLKTRAAESGIEIVVEDTGAGIPADDLPRIFERFYQVDKARGPKRGTGLGLAITREIVLAHGGRISASSAGKGRGSTFTLWLPRQN